MFWIFINQSNINDDLFNYAYIFLSSLNLWTTIFENKVDCQVIKYLFILTHVKFFSTSFKLSLQKQTNFLGLCPITLLRQQEKVRKNENSISTTFRSFKRVGERKKKFINSQS